MDYQLITRTEQLNAFCEQAMQKQAIAVDTEFVRTRTLYPQLGLIQLFDGDSLVLVDPLADVDLAALKVLLTCADVIKVLHSCSEDLETFQTAMGLMPAPLFDTQLATAMLNKGNAVGYARLIEEHLGLTLDKGESRTDWLARPLTERQLSYAANDVLYLFKVFPDIYRQVEQAGKLEWLYQEIELMKSKKSASLPSDYAYLTIKNNWRLAPKKLAVLKVLAKWRVNQAQQKNLALNFIVKETNLYEIANRLPKTKRDLFAIDGMNPHEVRRYGDVLLSMVNDTLHIPPEHFPAAVERLNDFPAAKGLSKKIRDISEQVANQYQLPVEMLASRKQIHQLLKWQWFELDETRLSGLRPDLLSGWRFTLMQDALAEIFEHNIKTQ